jgi:opacity protein-like surface antigen
VSSALTVAASRPVAAFERQWHVGANAGWAAVSWNDATHGGLGGGAHFTYGLTDAYNALVEVSGTFHRVYANTPPLRVWSGAAGVAYTLDVLQWVPYFGVLVGGYRFDGAELRDADHRLGFQLALGLDYRLRREWGIGVQLRYHTFSDDPLQTHYVTAFGRLEYMWGW